MQAYGQPGQPAYGQSSQPAYGQPVQPAYGQTVQPAYGQPVQPAYGHPANGQPVYGQPIASPYGQPGQAYPGGPQQYPGGPTLLVATPPGAPPGGVWIEDNYIGPLTCCIGIFCFVCIFCCPIDHRLVYMAPNGLKYLPDGRIVTDNC